MAIRKKKPAETTPRLVVVGSAAIGIGELEIDAGFQRLLQHFKDPHVAAEQFNADLRTNKVRLLADGAVVPVHFIVTHLVVIVRQAADGRWTAEVELHRSRLCASEGVVRTGR